MRPNIIHFYQGRYSFHPNQKLFIREDDNLKIICLRSKRPNHEPFYFRDLTNGRFISSMYRRGSQITFDYQGIKYEIEFLSESKEKARINAIGATKKRALRNPEPKRQALRRVKVKR